MALDLGSSLVFCYIFPRVLNTNKVCPFAPQEEDLEALQQRDYSKVKVRGCPPHLLLENIITTHTVGPSLTLPELGARSPCAAALP